MTTYDEKNKAELAYNQIKEKILSLEFPPRYPLREIELSQLLDMSRTPVRSAIAQLISDGFVEELGPKRNIVSSVSVDSFMSIHQVREVLEDLCVWLAAYAWNDPVEIVKIRSQLQEQITMTEELTIDSRAFLRADRAFHRALADLSRNPLLAQEMMRVYDLYWRYIFYSLHMDASRQIVQDHLDILDAIESRDTGRAKTRMREHLTLAKDSILMGLAKGFEPARELPLVKGGYALRTGENAGK